MDFKTLEQEIIQCKKCPRLVEYIGQIQQKFPDYWCRPVPGFGDVNARILMLGLAPGRYGSNRTGRMFTGDSSGNFMYPALYQSGLCNQPNATDLNDGLKLKNLFITAVGRCAPPQNKPTLQELTNCLPFAAQEIKLLAELRLVIALGKIAHDYFLKMYTQKLSEFSFKHGAIHRISGAPLLLDSYHPSRQNTQTGVLTKTMFIDMLKQAKTLADIV